MRRAVRDRDRVSGFIILQRIGESVGIIHEIFQRDQKDKKRTRLKMAKDGTRKD